MTENDNPTSLTKWCETRWDSRWSSINALIQNYEVLLISFGELENEGSEIFVDARGLLLDIKQPIFVITLFIVHKLFEIIKILSDPLKGVVLFSKIPLRLLQTIAFLHNCFLSVAKTVDFCKAQSLIKSVVNQITNLRSGQAFSDIYKQLISFCKHHHIDLSVTPRSRRTKNHIN